MPWTLETTGVDQPKKIEVIPGRTITIGRTEQALTPFPEDEWMSGLHFAVFVSEGALRVQNLSQTNGTEVNGQRMDAAVLQPGDQVKAGSTTFVAVGPAAFPFPAEARFGGWGFESVPKDWQALEGVGFQLPDEKFRASITAIEEPLPEGKTLAEYVEAQASLIRSNLPEAIVAEPVEAQIRGADGAFALTVTTKADGDTVVQRQIYAACRNIAGIFTATTLEKQEALRDTLARVVQGLSYFQG